MHDNRNRWHLILFSEINSLKYVIVALYNPSAVQIFFTIDEILPLKIFSMK